MIDFLLGKPRNGKSLRAMMYIWEELTLGTRFIITNLVLDLDVIQALLIKRGFNGVDVRKRIRMLDDQQTKNFWLYRADGMVLERPAGYDDKTGPDVDYSPVFETGDVKSVFYVIDEVHTHWRARGWAGTPRHVDFYNSQHGKMGDRVIFITQNSKLVDQNFCRLAQSFGYCRNHRLEKHGRFRGGNKFTMHVYPGPVTHDKEPTLNVETYHLDLEIAECYDTSAGVGMPGGGKADAGFRVKGIPLWTVWAGLAAVLVLAWAFFAYGLPKMTRGVLARGISGQELMKPDSPTDFSKFEIVDTPKIENNALRSQNPPLTASPGAPGPDRSQVKVRGYVRKGSEVLVLLSDGRTVTEREFQEGDWIRRGSVRLQGETLYFVQPDPRRLPATPPPASNAADSKPVPSPALPPPPPEPESSWETASDGVSRLRQTETLADLLKSR